MTLKGFFLCLPFSCFEQSEVMLLGRLVGTKMNMFPRVTVGAGAGRAGGDIMVSCKALLCKTEKLIQLPSCRSGPHK